ncbi:MAG: nitroreductase family protein [Lachnotalea sp.]
MDFINLAQKRYSVRKFMKKKVEKEKVDLILEAGRIAPTAVNYQPQRILVFNTEDSLNQLNNCTPYLFQAPLAMLICYDNTVSWNRSFDGYNMGTVDASIVATHMMLEVANLELGCTWVGHFDIQKIISTFKLPENIIPVVLLPMGYPDETSTPNPNHDKRLDIGETVFYNSYSSN